jgi:hypothetical protein
MAYLPSSAFVLTGGCFCGACTYTVAIPAREERPVVPGALNMPLAVHEHTSSLPETQDGTITRLPLVPIDHCTQCRRLLGGIVQCWFIGAQSWFSWNLLSKPASSPSDLTTFSTSEVVYSGKHYLSAFQSTPDDGTNGSVARTFCSRCGTSLTYAFRASEGAASRSLSKTSDGEGEVGKGFPALVNITVGSLDDESLLKVRPDRQGWWDSGVGWIKELLRKGDGGLMRHAGEDIGTIVED